MVNIIELKNIRKLFEINGKNTNHLVAIEDLSLAIKKGEFISIVGANGCGKTTILKLIAGLTEPSKGDIFMGGESTRNNLRKKIGYVPQGLALIPWKTVYENISFPLELRSSDITRPEERKERVQSAIKMVGLSLDFRNYLVHQLSGGMRQRVAIARALVINPDILLLDEPFSALDEMGREHLNQELLKVWMHLRPTVIFVNNQSLREAIYLSQRIIVLSERPSQLAGEVEINFDYPRKLKIQASPEFDIIYNKIRALLKPNNA